MPSPAGLARIAMDSWRLWRPVGPWPLATCRPRRPLAIHLPTKCETWKNRIIISRVSISRKKSTILPKARKYCDLKCFHIFLSWQQPASKCHFIRWNIISYWIPDIMNVITYVHKWLIFSLATFQKEFYIEPPKLRYIISTLLINLFQRTWIFPCIHPLHRSFDLRAQPGTTIPLSAADIPNRMPANGRLEKNKNIYQI